MHSSPNFSGHGVPQNAHATASSYPIDSSYPAYPNNQAPFRCPYLSSAQPNHPQNGPDYEEIILSAALTQKKWQRFARQLPQQLHQLHRHYLQQDLIDKKQQVAIAQAQVQRWDEYEVNNRRIQAQRRAEHEANYRRAQSQSPAMPTACNETPLPQRGPMVQQGQESATIDESNSNRDLEPMKRPQEESCQCKCHQGNNPLPQNILIQHEQDQKFKEEPERHHAIVSNCLSAVGTSFGGRDELSQTRVPQDPIKWKESSSCSFEGNNLSKITTAISTTAPTATGAPTSDSPPELNGKQQEDLTLLQHSELNQIDSALDNFSADLSEALEGALTENNKKTVLTVEEDIVKAMLQIDSVGVNDNPTVRQRRKALINKSQDMLHLVDNYRDRETNTGKSIDHDTAETFSEAPEHVSEVEAAPADIDGASPEYKPVHEFTSGRMRTRTCKTEHCSPKPTTAEAESHADSEEEPTDGPTIVDATDPDYEHQ